MKIQEQSISYNTFDDKILTIYLALKPLYLTASGSVQICDVFLIISTLLLVFQNNGKISYMKKESRWVNTLAILCVYQLIVNLIWYIGLGFKEGSSDNTLLISSLYYFFNLLVVFIVCTLNCIIGTDRVIKSLVDGCFYSSIVTGVGIVLNIGNQFRNTSFFNNPNQLGYHAIILLTIICLFWNYFGRKRRIMALAFCVWAVITSLSKAAFISLIFVGFAIIMNNKKGVRTSQLIRNMILLIVASVALYLLFFSDSSIVLNNSTLYSLRMRMLGIAQENDSNLGTGRGYDRIFEMGYNFLWGMGEGGFYRFGIMRGYETHSTYASILVSYGIIGLFGYAYLFLRVICRKASFHKLLALSGILLYWVSHNGIRNSIMWMLFIILILSEKRVTNYTNISTIEE